MRRFKKAMLVTAVVGGIGVTGAGTAQAGDSDGQPDVTVQNAQIVECEQQFSSSLITIAPSVSLFGDSITNIGNFCTVTAQRG
ncbi:hypothetical protein Sipo8835_41755 [Streptomyces ipomoeae]|jgi:hypothetical protein|uniref:Secreted protein n=2 Tax=Streptomyces ipomoeae TaxID=103232 RepID=L1L9I2_9ACTN|nr:hypothetical protein [Streptomyces ipomoeae]EKX69454.1 hypothetical protein STRIP9103_03207 [Streptomyces ipomoeae 91-03]MDX2698309.1 hypothetical protein [Streptomyces ipomoeae]MDX2820817.1 hypothetical protein [Streptomyces ipomoeae]MDX2839319.1 hypothetical protein [Streptomyces ipomoeae]MDX2873256.1 hypothetical protein [Streptomyces ipomoeae]